MPSITKDDAEKIAEKFGAQYEQGSNHLLAKIYYKGKKITQFGIRRSSKRDMPHNYISDQIYMSRTDCIAFGECDISVEEWVERMKEQGIITDEHPPPPPSHSGRKKKP